MRREDVILEKTLNEAFRWSKKGVKDETIDQIINETIGDMVSSLGGGLIESLKKQIAKYLLSFLNIDPNSVMGDGIATALGKLSFSDYNKVFQDCEFTTKFLVSVIINTMISQFRNKTSYTGPVYDALQFSIVNALESTEVAESMENSLQGFVCEKLPEMRQELLSKIPSLSSFI